MPSVYTMIEWALRDRQQSAPLLPRLQSITIIMDRDHPGWILSPFLHPTITSIDMYIHAESYAPIIDIQHVLQSLSPRCPHLQNVELAYDGRRPPVELYPSLELTFTGNGHITSLHLCDFVISTDVFIAISTIPGLRSLEFNITSCDIPPSARFSSITKCKITGSKSQHKLHSLIDTMMTPHFASLHIALHDSLRPQTIYDILKQLLPLRFTIKELDFFWDVDGNAPLTAFTRTGYVTYEDAYMLLMMQDDIIDENTLAPLSEFANIEVFRINVSSRFSCIDDHFIFMIASHCHRLKVLELGIRSPRQKSQVTLHGIICLVNGCRELEWLGIYFSPGDLHDRGMIVLHGNRDIKQLALGSSIIEKAQDVQTVTRLFKILFPGLTGLTWDTSITGWDDENEVESQSNWELVAASMGI